MLIKKTNARCPLKLKTLGFLVFKKIALFSFYKNSLEIFRYCWNDDFIENLCISKILFDNDSININSEYKLDCNYKHNNNKRCVNSHTTKINVFVNMLLNGYPLNDKIGFLVTAHLIISLKEIALIFNINKKQTQQLLKISNYRLRNFLSAELLNPVENSKNLKQVFLKNKKSKINQNDS
ncbi:uncharacterized protein ASCRUDRAFT_7128 [Ascoidea rubescens DSM 1968]|uniref:Uncharacterized protein n=1 Tax=Ascoidea rubescens DSM 1968 TaxID=1344418 RepID=A0A1D2VLU3_9ASCO|nr:hypothetical protein ASCRUDRAFT_7128 [Ascoidea rubescens DSM 1968]ODV62579.1 hypothetical protein ASCRUDRAFT_7128 [Ascoidea rubescens DSM 1968]